MTHGARLSWLAPLGIAAVAGVPFLPSLAGEFLHWDDDVNFLANPYYRGLGWANLRWMFTTTLRAVYAPVSWLSLGVNYTLGGMDPWGYHFGNLALHAANAALLYFVARRLIGAGLPREDHGLRGRFAVAVGATTAALAFAVHPLRVESVAWITERRDVLGGSFYLLSALAYLRGIRRGSLQRAWRAVSLAAFAAAVLSKGLTMTLPLSLLVLDAYPLRRTRRGWPALVREKAPYFLLALIGAGLAIVAVSRDAEWIGWQRHPLSARLALTAYSLWYYPGRVVWTHELSPLYELPVAIDPADARFLGPAAAVVGVTLALVRLRRCFPGGLAAWLHSAIALGPVSGLVHAGNQLVADRFSYLSGLGFALLFGSGVAWVIGSRSGKSVSPAIAALVVGAAALIELAWGVGAWRYAEQWVTSERLWHAAVEADPSCAICLNNLGGSLMEKAQGPDDPRLDEAEMLFRGALAVRPGYRDARLSLAALLRVRGRPAEAAPLPTAPEPR